ncbi:hypothetical protein KIN20_017908 [Parelaphostrongylus tenuis]|uniref:Uncharacterized protein n=1 Tax=Parelaphostrongylus tenuis TaxID=148309 RepID=A0AAD5N2Z9_PARTN|nr:hypothetical protein KIN20_017908 [Parelaphostrongylus tenuis]
MENETKGGVQEGNSEIYETKAIRYESNSTKPQCESRQMSSVKEDTGEDWHDVKKENDLDWDCHATDLLNASSSADVCGTDVSAHVRPLSQGEKGELLPSRCSFFSLVPL